MQSISNIEARNINGGKIYQCKICGYTSTSYAKAYANALVCVTKRYGLSVLKAASFIFG